jgi:hypothetical protein
MKNLFLKFALIASFSVFSQTTTPFIIEHCKDNMTDKEYYFSQKKLICANLDKTKGFALTPSFKTENGTMINNGLMCKNVNIGNCDEGDTLIFLFEDGSKTTITSWNKFNCEGNSYYDFSDDDVKQLSAKKVTTIRFSNGRTYDTLTYSLKATEQDYFIRLFTKFKVVEVDCSK